MTADIVIALVALIVALVSAGYARSAANSARDSAEAVRRTAEHTGDLAATARTELEMLNAEVWSQTTPRDQSAGPALPL